jgi:hypothetical protein
LVLSVAARLSAAAERDRAAAPAVALAGDAALAPERPFLPKTPSCGGLILPKPLGMPTPTRWLIRLGALPRRPPYPQRNNSAISAEIGPNTASQQTTAMMLPFCSPAAARLVTGSNTTSRRPRTRKKRRANSSPLASAGRLPQRETGVRVDGRGRADLLLSRW